MASVSLSIRKNPKGTGKIILNFNYGRKKKYRYPTAFNLENFKNWDSRNKKVKVIDEEPDAEEINLKLSELIGKADKLIRRYNSEKTFLNNNLIKRDFIKVLSAENHNNNDNIGFIEYYKNFIKHYATHPRPRTNKPYGKETLRTLRNSLNKLEEFETKHGYLEFNDINLDFHTELLTFLSEQGCGPNYMGAIIKNLKTVMQDAFDRNIHNNLDYKKASFNKPSEEVDNIYLTEEEILKISKVNLQELLDDKDDIYFEKGETRPTLDYFERCRAFFLIECETGLRVGDTLRLSNKNIIQLMHNGKLKDVLSIPTKKTNQPVLLPIKRTLKEIFDQYNGFPKKVSNSKIGKYIKKISKAAGIDEIIEIRKHIKGEDKVLEYYKYEKISNHTGRRSFCTNAYKADLATADIMSLSGHKSEKTFFKYIKATPRDRFNRLVDHPYFN